MNAPSIDSQGKGPSQGTRPPQRGDALSEVFTVFALAIGASLVAFWVPDGGARDVTFFLAWALVPIGWTIWKRRSVGSALGLLPRTPVRSLLWFVGAALVVLPPFTLGFAWWTGSPLRLPALEGMLAAPLAHLLWAPVSEELFWRGFAQTCLGPRPEGDPGAARSLRAHLPAITMAAALFALTHVVYLANPLSLHGLSRLATFFPGLLFGLVRLKGGDIYGAILLHALCNAWQFGLFSASA